MGTISQKLTYLNDTKGLIREAINDVGGELDENNTFRSYVDALKSAYDNLPKVTPPASNELYFQALRGRMDKTFKGDTEQESTTGKNLFNINDSNVTTNSANISINNNILIQANNGTYCRSVWAILNLVPNTDYTIKLKYNNPNNCLLRLALYNSTNTTELSTTEIVSNSAGELYLQLRPTDSTRYIRIYSNASSTSDKTNIVEFYEIQLESGSTATSYEPYTGGIPSPNPDYPQDIQVVKGKQTIKFNNRLPKAYTEVDYIESSGTQYIDTGIKGNNTTLINSKIKINSRTNIMHLLGDITDTSKAISFNLGGSVTPKSGWGNLETTTSFPVNTSDLFEISISEKGYYINETSYWDPTDNNFETTNNIYLFNANGSTSNRFNGRIYYCKIYDNDTLVRDFIPCFRDSDEEVGLYDLVNNTFYINAGTGVFTYGNEISNTYELNLKSKNLIKIADGTYTGTDYTAVVSNGKVTVNGTGTSTPSVVEIPLDIPIMCPAGTLLVLSAFNPIAQGSTSEAGNYFSIRLGDNVNTNAIAAILGNQNATASKTRTADITLTKLQIRGYSNGQFNNFVCYPQFELNSSIGYYEPYFDYELCKIDTAEDYFYEDSGKWYLHNEIEKTVLDGTWSNIIIASYTNTTRVYIKAIQRHMAISLLENPQLSNYLPNKNINPAGSDIEGFYASGTAKDIIIRVNKSKIGTTKDEVNQYLSEHNLITYYAIQEPFNTEITSPTLISQLEAIEAQRSVDGTNVITSECEEGLPVRIGVSALLKEVS